LRRLAPQRHTLRWRNWAALAAVVCLASASAALLAPASAAASSQTMFTLVGRGWGHGIGMSQYGAEGYAINQPTWNYWNIITHYYTGVTRGKVSNKTIRVLLQSGISNATIAATGEYTITPSTAATSAPSATVPGGASATVNWSSSANMYQVVSGAQKWSFASAPVFTPVGSSTLLKVLTPDDNGHTGRYRGTVSIIHGSSGLSIVNSLPLESYLQGVVPREMPASWKPVALQAQAVAARAYAYRAIDGRGTFDVYCDTRSQVYGGYDVETPATNATVSSTAGVVPLYGGSVIQAFFFSTSGGYTENNENVWGSAPLPYLRGVPDPYDTISPYHLWPDNPIIRSATTVAGQLATYDSDLSSATLGNLTTIAVLQRGVSPRVVKALVVGSSGTAIVSGTDLRVGHHDEHVALAGCGRQNDDQRRRSGYLERRDLPGPGRRRNGDAALLPQRRLADHVGANNSRHPHVWRLLNLLLAIQLRGQATGDNLLLLLVRLSAIATDGDHRDQRGDAGGGGGGAADPPGPPPRGRPHPKPPPGYPLESPGCPRGSRGHPLPPAPPPAARSPSPVRSSHRSSAARPCGCRHGAAQRGTMPPAPASARRAPSVCAGSLWPVSMRCACARLLRPAS
jgi:stage II sporulation protein D